MFVWPGEEQSRIDFTAVEIVGAVSHLKLLKLLSSGFECLEFILVYMFVMRMSLP